MTARGYFSFTNQVDPEWPVLSLPFLRPGGTFPALVGATEAWWRPSKTCGACM